MKRMLPLENPLFTGIPIGCTRMQSCPPGKTTQIVCAKSLRSLSRSAKRLTRCTIR